jgi:hypothetical protein
LIDRRSCYILFKAIFKQRRFYPYIQQRIYPGGRITAFLSTCGGDRFSRRRKLCHPCAVCPGRFVNRIPKDDFQDSWKIAKKPAIGSGNALIHGALNGPAMTPGR